MNLVLLSVSDFGEGRRVRLTGRRFRHIKQVIRPVVGDTVTVGLLNGDLGEAEVLTLDAQSVELDVVFDRPPPPPLPVVLLMALPRPKSLSKILQLAATMGVKQIHLYNSSRVDKSFWQSKQLRHEAMAEHLRVGLEQAKDTTMPTVELHRLFAPFINDAMPALIEGRDAYLAHPADAQRPCPHRLEGPAVLAVGPERGLIDYEVRRFMEAGFEVVGLGPRVLRVEQALAVALAKMFD